MDGDREIRQNEENWQKRETVEHNMTDVRSTEMSGVVIKNLNWFK